VNVSRFTLCFLGLAFCVFTWGLQYKLSLYDPPQAVSHEIPTAKLLSRNEQTSTTESPLLRKSSAFDKAVRMTLFSIFLTFLLALSRPYRCVLLRDNSDMQQPWKLRIQASLDAFFFRPPPAILV